MADDQKLPRPQLTTVWVTCRKSAVEVAESLYRRARKRRRAVGQVAPLLEAARAQLAYLQEVEWNLEANLGADANTAALREIQVCSSLLCADAGTALEADQVLHRAGRLAAWHMHAINQSSGGQSWADLCHALAGGAGCSWVHEGAI